MLFGLFSVVSRMLMGSHHVVFIMITACFDSMYSTFACDSCGFDMYVSGGPGVWPFNIAHSIDYGNVNIDVFIFFFSIFSTLFNINGVI